MGGPLGSLANMRTILFSDCLFASLASGLTLKGDHSMIAFDTCQFELIASSYFVRIGDLTDVFDLERTLTLAQIFASALSGQTVFEFVPGGFLINEENLLMQEIRFQGAGVIPFSGVRIELYTALRPNVIRRSAEPEFRQFQYPFQRQCSRHYFPCNKHQSAIGSARFLVDH